MNLRVVVSGEAKRFRRGAGAKASVNSAHSRWGQTRNQVIDPGPG